MSADHSGASSDDDDDDYLTVNSNNNKVVDREALVRKKLLESFYGKSAVASAVANQQPSMDDNDDDDDDDDSPIKSSRLSSKDLDSPDFDASDFVHTRIVNDSLPELLDTEEQLSLQVRTLDSTMQTLVYENYTRFIDATDAIKNIGVNVRAVQDETESQPCALDRLVSHIQNIDDTSQLLEDKLGTLRDELTEQYRVQRLLQRLASLLQMPTTLQQWIAEGKYSKAVRSYYHTTAASMLRQQAASFESLARIESECVKQLQQLHGQLQHVVGYWSGTVFMQQQQEDDNRSIPDPPSNMNDIFESIGALYLLEQQQQNGAKTDMIDQLPNMATSSALRLLERLLDAHHVQVQERRLGGSIIQEASLAPPLDGMSERDMSVTERTAVSTNETSALSLIAHDFLSALVEGASMLALTFLSNDSKTSGLENVFVAPEAMQAQLNDFCREAFSSFLHHSKSILLEETALANAGNDDLLLLGTSSAIPQMGDPEGSTAHTEATPNRNDDTYTAQALQELVPAAKDAVTGLSQSAGMSKDLGDELVNHVQQLVQGMVHRRVDHQFQTALRQQVIENCLEPFASRLVESTNTSATKGSFLLAPELLSTSLDLANTTLQDCLQLVDDTVRSVLTSSSSPQQQQLPDLNQAVSTSAKRFCFWLATALEFIAGGVYDNVVDQQPTLLQAGAIPDETLEAAEDVTTAIAAAFPESADDGNVDDPGRSREEEDLLVKLQGIRQKLVCNGGAVSSNYMLVVAELCRVCANLLADNLEQSIVAYLGGKKKLTKGRLQLAGETDVTSTDNGNDNSDVDDIARGTVAAEDEISQRFIRARSTVMVLYGMNRGSVMASLLCDGLCQVAEVGSTDSDRPSDGCTQALAVVKSTSLECAAVFGDKRRAGPVTDLEDSHMSVVSPLPSRKTGLQLDVERMFKQTVPIYPHPSEVIDVNRNSICFLLLKIAFRAAFEHARLYRFSTSSYSQVLMDTEFLKHMVSHYIERDYNPKGANAVFALESLINDVQEVASERCIDGDMAEEKDEISLSNARHLRSFLDASKSSAGEGGFIIPED